MCLEIIDYCYNLILNTCCPFLKCKKDLPDAEELVPKIKGVVIIESEEEKPYEEDASEIKTPDEFNELRAKIIE